MDNNIFDIHTHILFGVDDGARDLQMSLSMLQMAYDDGIGAVFLTPHTDKGCFDFEKAKRNISELIKAAGEQRPKIFTGCEIMYSPSVCESLKKGKLPTLAGSRYVLCEFAPAQTAKEIKDAVGNLCRSGFYPILAHVDRYSALKKAHIAELVESGAFIQLSSRSVTGVNGIAKRMFCDSLLKKSLVHFIASDAHSTNHRKPELSKAYEYVSKKFGADYAAEIFYKNPSQIINNTLI